VAENVGVDRISSLIAGTLAKRGLAQHALASMALHRVNAWIAAAFPGARPSAHAERIADGVLTVACDHSVIVQELQLRLPELKRFIEAECPFATIVDVRVIRSQGGPGNALAPRNPPA
jgi:hypothetical protein